MTNRFFFGSLVGAAALVAGCGDLTQLPPQADMGAQPVLLAPVKQLVPTVNIAPAQGWPDGVLPQPMAGLRVTALARGLETAILDSPAYARYAERRRLEGRDG